ncbi:MAG: DUF1543 domain-containing protein [Candidatus Moraniibacteriota bacterium]|nr:MAG: DUF1543 domain-containing protein [Candidatus Moranbacteria bacterium]
MPKLFIVFLGGRLSDNRMGEDHEVVAVVAEDDSEAKLKAREQWKGLDRKSVHIDSMMELSRVGGYAVSLSRIEGGEDDVQRDNSYVPLS